MSIPELSIINCTPHDVYVYDQKGETSIAKFPKSPFLVRLDTEPQKETGKLKLQNGTSIPICSPQKFKELLDLPPYDKPETCPDIIVSMLVAQKLAETKQWPGAVYVPDTNAGAVRSAKGELIGTKFLVCYCERAKVSATPAAVESTPAAGKSGWSKV